jgi:hypothetical protein
MVEVGMRNVEGGRNVFCQFTKKTEQSETTFRNSAVRFSTLRTLIPGVILGLYFSAFRIPTSRRGVGPMLPLWAGGRIPSSVICPLTPQTYYHAKPYALCSMLYAVSPPQLATRNSQPTTRNQYPATN